MQTAWISCFRATAGARQRAKNPVRGGLFIEDRDPLQFFLFFGATGGGFEKRAGSAPKNKKREGWRGRCYRQATPNGV